MLRLDPKEAVATGGFRAVEFRADILLHMPRSPLLVSLLGWSLLAVYLSASASNARASRCDERQAYAAETVTDYLDSWQNVTYFYKEFRRCDDGGVAEGVSDAVAKLLAQQWQLLPELLKDLDTNPGLNGFVLRHLDETDDSNDLDRIDRLAETRCPASASEFCKKIRARIESLARK